jgi:hypothetical protein
MLTVRVLLDEKLFKQMSLNSGTWPNGEAIDASLERVLKRNPRNTGRTMQDRIQGGMRLYKAQVMLSIVHGASLLASYWLQEV